MTFKHVKFQDSVVMRSLERVAKEKGLVKAEDLVKTAETKKTNLAPSAALLVNLINLSAGLREAGFDKYADELENNMLAYKKAQTLYETSKEKGEDLIDAAHPKGSHKLEDVDGGELAEVETIIDQHLKSLDMINKKPTGKLASVRDILTAVRVVLAEQGSEELKAALREAAQAVATIDRVTADELTFSIKGYTSRAAQLANSPTVDSIEEFKDLLSRLASRLNPSGAFHYLTLGTGGLSKDTWSRVQGLLSKANAAVGKALEIRTKMNQAANSALEKGEDPSSPTPTAKPVENPNTAKLTAAKQQLAGISGLVNADTTAKPEDVKAIKGWIAMIDGKLKELESQVNSMSPQDFAASIAKLTKDFAVVRQDWA